MMEKIRMDRMEKQMPITKEAVIESLLRNPEDHTVLTAWLAEREAEVARINTSKATLELNIERAEVYRDAGFQEQAHKDFEEALRIILMDSSITDDERDELTKRVEDGRAGSNNKTANYLWNQRE